MAGAGLDPAEAAALQTELIERFFNVAVRSCAADRTIPAPFTRPGRRIVIPSKCSRCWT
jgi:hypothetical protein